MAHEPLSLLPGRLSPAQLELRRTMERIHRAIYEQTVRDLQLLRPDAGATRPTCAPDLETARAFYRRALGLPEDGR